MAITSTYPIIAPKLTDLIVGTQTYTAADPVLDNPTRNFTVQSIANVVQNNGGTTNVIPAFSATGLVDSLVSQDDQGLVFIGSSTGTGTRFTNTSISTPNLVGADLYVTNIYGGNGGILNIQGNSTIGNEASDTLTVEATSTFNQDLTLKVNNGFAKIKTDTTGTIMIGDPAAGVTTGLNVSGDISMQGTNAGIYLTSATAAIYMTSPDGTAYKIQIANGGTFNITQV
tara:strand:+ start:23 stop:706 length:684 start_codon:yes stop_codon:yes gene_type:complete